MKTEEFESFVNIHSLQPNNELYNSNALSGEAGETANIVKKMQFEKLKPEWIGDGICSIAELKEKIGDELGDVLFYLTRLALDNGFTLVQLMDIQKQKIDNQSKKYNRLLLK